MNLAAQKIPAPGSSINLWAAVFKLLKLRWVIFSSGLRRSSGRRKLGMLVLLLLFLGFIALIFSLSWFLLRFLRSPQLAEVIGSLQTLIDAMPALILSGAFFGILLTSFGVLLQALYLSGDMDFLLTTPVPIRAVFVAKLLQAILPNFTLICAFSLPVLFGLGASQGYNLLFYPMLLLMMVALALAAAGLSSLLVMLVTRLVPARRVAEVLGFLGAMLSFLCSQSGQLMRNIDGPPQQQQISLMINTAHRLNSGWSPLAWAGYGLVELGKSNWISGLGLSFLTLGLACAAFFFALSTAERWYYTGWAGMQGTAHKKKPVQSAKIPATQGTRLAHLVPASLRAIVVKDYYVMRRDLRNMSQLVTPLIFGIIYAFSFFREGRPEIEQSMSPWMGQLIRNLPLYGSVGISLFVGWMLLARLAGVGISQEGRSYWLLKTAPVRPWQLLLAKFLVAYLPTLVLGWIFLLCITLVQRADPASLSFTLPVVALCIAGNAGLNLAFGVLGANLDWEDPRKMQPGGAGCLGALVSMGYLPLSLGLFFGPEVLFSLLGWPATAGQVAGLLIGISFSLACTLIPLLLVIERVPHLGEK